VKGTANQVVIIFQNLPFGTGGGQACLASLLRWGVCLGLRCESGGRPSQFSGRKGNRHSFLYCGRGASSLRKNYFPGPTGSQGSPEGGRVRAVLGCPARGVLPRAVPLSPPSVGFTGALGNRLQSHRSPKAAPGSDSACSRGSSLLFLGRPSSQCPLPLKQAGLPPWTPSLPGDTFGG